MSFWLGLIIGLVLGSLGTAVALALVSISDGLNDHERQQ